MFSRVKTALSRPQSTARWTGVVGVLVLTSGSYAHSVNSRLIALESAETTAQNLETAETLFRQGIVSGLLMGVIFVQGFFFPEQVGSLWTNPALVVTHLAEISLMLWLLVMGVNADRWEIRAAEAGISR